MENLTLSAKKCTPCQGGIPAMTPEEAEQYRSQLLGWELRDDATCIQRTFRCPDFMEAMKMARQVGELCEEDGHHADITFGWGYCQVSFQTHKINGLHENDFIMAAKVNALGEHGLSTMRQIKEEVE